MRKDFSIIAHRGASSKEPENTLAAIRHAIELGVDCVEIDVQLSEDGIPVVIHDDTLCRTTNAAKGQKVREVPTSHLKKFDAGSWFHGIETLEKVPTLEEVLQLDFKKTGLMVEIKDDVNHDLCTAVDALLRRCSIKELFVGSSSPKSIIYFHKQLPELKLIAIVNELEHLDHFKDAKANYIALEESLFKKEVVANLSFGYSSIWAFTVDDPQKADLLKSFGVKGIITNDPEVWLKKKER